MSKLDMEIQELRQSVDTLREEVQQLIGLNLYVRDVALTVLEAQAAQRTTNEDDYINLLNTYLDRAKNMHKSMPDPFGKKSS